MLLIVIREDIHAMALHYAAAIDAAAAIGAALPAFRCYAELILRYYYITIFAITPRCQRHIAAIIAAADIATALMTFTPMATRCCYC